MEIAGVHLNEAIDAIASDHVQVFLGVPLAAYGMWKVVSFVIARKAFTEVSFDKRFGITARIFCATNSSVRLFAALLFFECFAKLSRLYPPLAPYGKAYEPISIALSLIILWLILWCYWQLFLNAQTQEAIAHKRSERVRHLQEEFRKRQISEWGLLTVPLISLVTTAAPFIKHLWF